MAKLDVVVLKKHPDRYPGTWWPLRRIGKERIARIACHECGEVSQFVSREDGDFYGDLQVKWMCRVTECGWTGLVRLKEWRKWRAE